MRAFTLVEVLMYIGLFSLLMSSLFASAALLQDTGTQVAEIAARIQSTVTRIDSDDVGVHLVSGEI
jgi:type II secretory pathway pseudopilin PulG